LHWNSWERILEILAGEQRGRKVFGEIAELRGQIAEVKIRATWILGFTSAI
jgi:hypothetical protein